MKETLSTNQVADRLKADDNANWSYAGARALAEYLEQIEEDTGEEMEFDRVAIRCDFSEYDSATAAATDYGFEFDNVAEEHGEDADDEAEKAALAWLQERTTVIEFDGGIIVQSV